MLWFLQTCIYVCVCLRRLLSLALCWSSIHFDKFIESILESAQLSVKTTEGHVINACGQPSAASVPLGCDQGTAASKLQSFIMFLSI